MNNNHYISVSSEESEDSTDYEESDDDFDDEELEENADDEVDIKYLKIYSSYKEYSQNEDSEKRGAVALINGFLPRGAKSRNVTCNADGSQSLLNNTLTRYINVASLYEVYYKSLKLALRNANIKKTEPDEGQKTETVESMKVRNEERRKLRRRKSRVARSFRDNVGQLYISDFIGSFKDSFLAAAKFAISNKLDDNNLAGYVLLSEKECNKGIVKFGYIFVFAEHPYTVAFIDQYPGYHYGFMIYNKHEQKEYVNENCSAGDYDAAFKNLTREFIHKISKQTDTLKLAKLDCLNTYFVNFSGCEAYYLLDCVKRLNCSLADKLNRIYVKKK